MTDPSDRNDADRLLGPGSGVIGRIIGGNYRILKLIGTGAMGQVYQAEQLSLGKMVALKLLRQELAGDEKLIKRFELEAKNASLLNHPNSIQIIDFGREGDLLYIAMELLPGVDLGQLILRDGPIGLPRLARIMDQVLAALDEAHAAGVVHRDLKPGNIMLVPRRDDPDFVKVCDFGIAKAQSSEGAGLTLKGLVCGTPEYMSPEQARGEDVDGRSDLYSVGIILYQLVTGTLPFTASSPVGILSKHLSEPPLPPTLKRPGLDLPPAFEALILQALSKDPGGRPRSADAMRRALRAAVANLPAEPGAAPSATSFAAMADQPTTPLGLPARRTPRGGTIELPSSQDNAPTLRGRPGGRGKLWLGGGLLLGTVAAAWFLVATPPVPMVAPAAPVAQAPVTPPVMPAVAPVAAEEKLPVIEPPAARERPRRERRAPARPARPAREDEVDLPAPAVVAAPDPTPPPRAPDPMKEAERLLGQGDVAGACAKGEEHRRAVPEAAPVYKFLGKCYMRVGKPEQAMANYRRYLELAPDAPDAAFIRSIVK